MLGKSLGSELGLLNPNPELEPGRPTEPNKVVGELVGTGVGNGVGRFVGTKVGGVVGNGVGGELGPTVGLTVGGGVGKKVGGAVGLGVGKEVGSELGIALGTELGETVGDAVSAKPPGRSTFRFTPPPGAGGAVCVSVGTGVGDQRELPAAEAGVPGR